MTFYIKTVPVSKVGEKYIKKKIMKINDQIILYRKLISIILNIDEYL